MSKYSDEKMIEMANDVLNKLSKEESIDFAKYLLMKNWPENNILIREKIFKFLRENKVATKTGVNWKFLHITDFGKLVANEIGGLKQFIYNHNNPITDDKKLKIDFVNYVVKNEQANKISKTTNYSIFRKIEKERVENCAEFLIEKNIIKLIERADNNELTVKPREPAYRIKEKPQEFDLIVKTAKYNQDSSDFPSEQSRYPITKQAAPKINAKINNDTPSRKLQTWQIIISIIIAVVAIATFILKINGKI